MSKEEEIRQQMNEAREARIAEVASEFDQAQSEMASIPNLNPQLPEYHFVKAFLPFFAGDKELPYPVTMTHWVNVAGSIYQEVDIIDPATNQVLFTVPPIVDRDAHVDFKSERGETSINSIVEAAKNIANVHPAQSEHYLRTELQARYGSMGDQSHAVDHAKRWNAIFARYGRPPIEVKGLQLGVDEAKPNAERVSFDGFDEL